VVTNNELSISKIVFGHPIGKETIRKGVGPGVWRGGWNLRWTLAGRDSPDCISPYRTVLCRQEAGAGQSRRLRR
jgi:hypothetical protein